MQALATGSPEYQRVHWHVVRIHGKASDLSCIDCGGQARDWSWDHKNDPAETSSYDPRCGSCHQKFDMTDSLRAKVSAVRLEASILSDDDRDEMRDMYATGDWSQRELAKLFGVSKTCVHSVIHKIYHPGRKFTNGTR